MSHISPRARVWPARDNLWIPVVPEWDLCRVHILSYPILPYPDMPLLDWYYLHPVLSFSNTRL